MHEGYLLVPLLPPPPRKLKPIWGAAMFLMCIENWGDIGDLSRISLIHEMVMLPNRNVRNIA